MHIIFGSLISHNDTCKFNHFVSTSLNAISDLKKFKELSLNCVVNIDFANVKRYVFVNDILRYVIGISFNRSKMDTTSYNPTLCFGIILSVLGAIVNMVNTGDELY